MKHVILSALFKTVCSLLIIFVLVTVLQYVAWHQPRQDLIIHINYPNAAAEHFEIHNSGDSFHPCFFVFSLLTNKACIVTGKTD
jgi:hypothetical protein